MSGNYGADVMDRRFEMDMESADQESAMIDEEWYSLQSFGAGHDAATWIDLVEDLLDRDTRISYEVRSAAQEEVQRLDDQAFGWAGEVEDEA